MTKRRAVRKASYSKLFIQGSHGEGKELCEQVDTILKSKKDFLNLADDIMNCEGDFKDYIYNMTVLYLTRRFLILGKQVQKNIGSLSTTWNQNMRTILTENYCLDEHLINKIIHYVKRSIETADLNIEKQTRTDIERKIKQHRYNCYICGESLVNVGDVGEWEPEHLWPHSLGGSSDEDNLKPSCPNCNRAKADHMSSVDFHITKMVFVSTSENLPEHLPGPYRVSALLKFSGQCSACGDSFLIKGPAVIKKNKINDSWNFFNIKILCSSCKNL